MHNSYGDFEYTVLADGTAQITNYLGTDSEIVVPAEIDKIKVTGFSGISFFGIPSDAEKLRLSKVKKVTLSDGITFLGSGSFYGNDAIEEIVLPDSITSLGDFVFDGELDTSNSFNGCTSLKKITLSNGLTKLPMNTFRGCTSLETIKLPDSITVLDQWAFSGCSGLKEVILSNKTESIGWECFLGCKDLKSITIPASIKSISSEALGYDEEYAKVDGFTIYGYKGTAAEEYATNNGFKFVDADNPAPAKKSIAKATVTAANKVYTGKALKPAVTVKLSGKTLKSGTDYTVAYKNNKNCGKATVTVTGKGDYTGSKSGSFIIKPKKVAAKKLTSPKTKRIKLTWTKAAGGVTGYEVQVALDKKFKKSARSCTVKASAASKTVKSLKKGKKYFARVRAYKTVGKTKYYGAWSAVKSVKCK